MIKTVSRSAAASFVVTVGMLAGGAVAGCNPPPPRHANPPHVEGEGHHGNHGHEGQEGHHSHEGHDGHHGDHQNPPAPATINKNPPAPADDTGHGHANPPGPQPADGDAGLAPAPAGWKVTTREDNTCWARGPVSCPEGVRCNPPAPRQVKCP